MEDCAFLGVSWSKKSPPLRVGSSLLVLVLEVELHRLVRVVGFKLVDIIREVRAVGVHGFKHLQVLSVVPCLLTAIIIHALRVSASEKPNYFRIKLFLFFSSFFRFDT